MGFNALERLYHKTIKTDTCWLWCGTKNLDGYGRIKINGRLFAVHRVSYEWYSGKSIPEGKQVLHTCDVPNCVNPQHLFLGTHSDNMQDMYKKKRHGNGKPCVCHPERPYHAKGFCKQCYLKNYRS